MKLNLNRVFSSVLMIAWLVGCSSANSRPPVLASTGPVSAPTAPRHPELETAGNRPVIVAFGDSLTSGLGLARDQSYPADLQRDLEGLGYNYRVVNEGISGNTTKDGVLRIPEVLQFHPAVVIVAFGGNDGMRGVPISDTEMNLSTIVSAMQDAHAKVILAGITLPPNYGSEYIHRFDAIYLKESTIYRVPLLRFMLKGVYGVPGSIQEDGIHPTAKGCQQVARNFLPLLLPLLHKPAQLQAPPHAH